MSDEWIIDVLTDLRRFARERGMTATAAELEDVCLVALAELAEARGEEGMIATGHEAGTGAADRGAGQRRLA